MPAPAAARAAPMRTSWPKPSPVDGAAVSLVAVSVAAFVAATAAAMERPLAVGLTHSVRLAGIFRTLLLRDVGLRRESRGRRSTARLVPPMLHRAEVPLPEAPGGR